MADLGTRAGATLFFERRRAEVANEVLRGGELVRPRAWLIARREQPEPGNVNPKTGLPIRPTAYLDTPEVVDCPMPAWLLVQTDVARAKAIFMQCLRMYSKALEADGWCVAMEALMSQYELTKPKPDPKTDPNAQEVLAFAIVHRDLGNSFWIAEVERDPISVGPWVQSDEGAEIGGSMFRGKP